MKKDRHKKEHIPLLLKTTMNNGNSTTTNKNNLNPKGSNVRNSTSSSIKRIVERFQLTSMSILPTPSGSTPRNSKIFRVGGANRIDLLRSRDRMDASAKRGFRVSVPTKLLLYVAIVFFIIPLLFAFYILVHRIFIHDAHHHRSHHHQHVPNQQQVDLSFQEGEVTTGLRGAETSVEVIENSEVNSPDSQLTVPKLIDQPDNILHGNGKVALTLDEAVIFNAEGNSTSTTAKNNSLMKDEKIKVNDEQAENFGNGDLTINQPPPLEKAVIEGETAVEVKVENRQSPVEVAPNVDEASQQQHQELEKDSNVIIDKEGNMDPPKSNVIVLPENVNIVEAPPGHH